MEALLWFLLGFFVAVVVLRGYVHARAWVIAREMKKEYERKRKEVLEGMVFEQFVPFSAFPFNPRDVRFLGSPVDFIVFEGLSDVLDGREKEITIHFVEVKKGNSGQTKTEKAVQEAVERKRVKYYIVSQ